MLHKQYMLHWSLSGDMHYGRWLRSGSSIWTSVIELSNGAVSGCGGVGDGG